MDCAYNARCAFEGEENEERKGRRMKARDMQTERKRIRETKARRPADDER